MFSGRYQPGLFKTFKSFDDVCISSIELDIVEKTEPQVGDLITHAWFVPGKGQAYNAPAWMRATRGYRTDSLGHTHMRVERALILKIQRFREHAIDMLVLVNEQPWWILVSCDSSQPRECGSYASSGLFNITFLVRPR